MMFFKLLRDNFSAILDHYNQHGFVVLTGVDPRITSEFRNAIASLSGLSVDQIRNAGRDESLALPAEVRSKIARPQTSPEMQELLISVLGDLIMEMLGPIIHISRDFHPQIKKGAHQHILSGYSGDGLEVEAPYGLHQDFTAGRVLTSPNAVVCWIPLNTCDQNGLRLYPGSHSKGLLTNRWLPYDVPGIERIGDSIDISAREGQVLLFNFLLLHCTLRTGPKTRVSSDVRFFPFCGILNSPGRVLRRDPVNWIYERLEKVKGDTLRAAHYETLAYLGEPIDWPDVPPYSPIHWARFIQGMVNHEEKVCRNAIEQLANVQVGFDDLSAYLKRFAQVPIERLPYQSVLPYLSEPQQGWCKRLLAREGSVTKPMTKS